MCVCVCVCVCVCECVRSIDSLYPHTSLSPHHTSVSSTTHLSSPSHTCPPLHTSVLPSHTHTHTHTPVSLHYTPAFLFWVKCLLGEVKSRLPGVIGLISSEQRPVASSYLIIAVRRRGQSEGKSEGKVRRRGEESQECQEVMSNDVRRGRK